LTSVKPNLKTNSKDNYNEKIYSNVQSKATKKVTIIAEPIQYKSSNKIQELPSDSEDDSENEDYEND